MPKVFVENHVKIKKHTLLGACVLKKLWGADFRQTRVLRIPVSTHGSPKASKDASAIQWYKTVRLLTLNKNVETTVVYFDLALGGGTETYFYAQKDQQYMHSLVVRVQYFSEFEQYKISFWYKNVFLDMMLNSLDALMDILKKIKITEIVVNNLVGYKNTLDMLDIIASLKQDGVRVSMRGHDYQSICPHFTLLNHKKEFCNLPNEYTCANCFRLNLHCDDEFLNKTLMSGATDIKTWRTKWRNFFDKYLDEIIVFSECSKNLFLRAYPCLQDKISVIPHKVPQLRPVNTNKHRPVTIGILGDISSVHKGRDIVRQMHYMGHNYSASVVVIGVCGDTDIPSTGRYNVNDLTRIIENHNIDIIFIPSIWPETFSYTTSEAMSMNVPVACFNLGAPAERVREYDKGLVINDIDATNALQQIVKFVNKS